MFGSNSQWRFTAWMLLVSMAVASLSVSAERDEASLKSDLQQRAESRWQALIEHDFRRVYEYQTPAYRELYSFEHFRAGYARGPWLSARVTEISLAEAGVGESESNSESDVPITAQVNVSVEVAATFPSTSSTVRADTMLEENWIHQAGEWWYVD